MADQTNPPAGGAQGAQAQQGPPPPRPGERVPTGGLDPTQVFATPPPPPPQQQGGGQQQDQGPPPPPPGPLPSDEELKKKGYDDEDIKILKEVNDYRFGSISKNLNNDNIVVPSHPETKFDEQKFLTLLRGSISLTRDEKWRIVQAIPKLSQFQIDELQKILEEEKRKFGELSPKPLLQLKKLEEKRSEDRSALQAITVQPGARQEEQQKADEIRKQLGL